jgi:hypothetical protein
MPSQLRDTLLVSLALSAVGCSAGTRPSILHPQLDLSGSWQVCVSARRGQAAPDCGPMKVVADSYRNEAGEYKRVYYVSYDLPVDSILGRGKAVPGYGSLLRWGSKLRLTFSLPPGALAEFGGGLHADLTGTADSLGAQEMIYCYIRCTKYGRVVLKRLPTAAQSTVRLPSRAA